MGPGQGQRTSCGGRPQGGSRGTREWETKPQEKGRGVLPPERRNRDRGKVWKGVLGVGGDFRFAEKSRRYISSTPFIYYNE